MELAPCRLYCLTSPVMCVRTILWTSPCRTFVPATVDANYPNACYLKKSGGGWTVQTKAGVTSGTVQGLSVQAANNQPVVQNVTTVQTIYNTVSINIPGLWWQESAAYHRILDLPIKLDPLTLLCHSSQVTNTYLTYELQW